MPFSFFGKHISNSDKADDVHDSSFNSKDQLEISDMPNAQEAKADEKKWVAFTKYPMFQGDFDSDDDFTEARCSRCKGSFYWDDADTHDGFYLALEMHEIKHLLMDLNKIQTDAKVNA